MCMLVSRGSQYNTKLFTWKNKISSSGSDDFYMKSFTDLISSRLIEYMELEHL